MSASPLSSLIEALARPLRFAASDDFARLERVKGLEALVKAQVAVARPLLSDSFRPWLDRLDSASDGMDASSGEMRRQRVGLLLDLLESAAEPTSGAEEVVKADSPPPRKRSPAREKEKPPTRLSPDSLLADLPGVGLQTAGQLERLGLVSLKDLLFHLPRDYQDRSHAPPIAELQQGQETLVTGTVAGVWQRSTRRGRMLEVVVEDGSGAATCLWWKAPPYLAKAFVPGEKVGVFGRVDRLDPQPTLHHPDVHDLGETGILPIYPTTEGFGQKRIRRLVAAALGAVGGALEGRVPAPIRESRRLPPLGEALGRLHQPAGDEDLQGLREGTSASHRAVLFEELFGLQLALAFRRFQGRQRPGLQVEAPLMVQEVMGNLPYVLTRGQVKAIADIHRDLASGRPMGRLLQGDVGCGKTVVALLGSLPVLASGHQVAVMAPTEILADQHLETFSALLAPLGFRVSLLSGSLRSRPRRQVLEHCAAGTCHVCIGTQALFQGEVAFARLGMVVVDEQHRFGVDQRAALAEKGSHPGGAHPHLLAMTATPIPRSLALTLYGDLDLTVIDELPPRGEVRTLLIPEREREKAYAAVRRVAEEGGRAFVVYSLVEGKEGVDARDAVSMAEELARGPLLGIPLGLLHGRMDPRDKEAVLNAFRRGDLKVLVTTTAIEVGVDVKEATCIVVEGAERFGLAQLHQMRGRVGRNQQPGECLLVHRQGKAAERLEILASTRSGFDIAEADFRHRGPGDLLGTRQAGRPALALSASPGFAPVLADARREAFALVEREGFATDPAWEGLRQEVRRQWGRSLYLSAG